jgi:hypothetical protein
MLAGSATFRALVVATEALDSIIEHDGGSPMDNGADGIAISCSGAPIAMDASPFALVVQSAITADSGIALGWQRLTGTIDVWIHVPSIAGLATQERTRRALNLAGVIREEMRAQIGTTGCLALCAFTAGTMPLPDDVGAEAGGICAHLTIEWRNG